MCIRDRGITGVRSKRVTKQVQLNMMIDEGTYENTFLVVHGLNLEVILGNAFLIRHRAVINFKKRVLELSHEIKPIRVSFERVSDMVRISGVRVIQNRVSDRGMEVSVNACRERERERMMNGENNYGKRGHTSFVVRVAW